MPSFRHHATDALRLQRAPFAGFWIFLVAAAAGGPLIAGELFGHGAVSIFGSLLGYCLALSTDRGSLRHRWRLSFIAFVAYAAAFSFGVLFRERHGVLFLMSACMPYAIGVVAGKAREAERILIFGGIQFYVAWYASSVGTPALPIVYGYFLLPLFTVLGGTAVAAHLRRLGDVTPPELGAAARYFRPRIFFRQAYAIVYTGAVLGSVWLVDYYGIERGYWTVITTLLLLKPTRRESFQRVMQRIFGTVLGAVIGGFLIQAHPTGFTTVFLATVFAGLVPFVWSRNYWLVSACATLFVFCLLDVATYGELPSHVIWVRVKATLLGAAVSVLAIFAYHLLQTAAPRAGAGA